MGNLTCLPDAYREVAENPTFLEGSEFHQSESLVFDPGALEHSYMSDIVWLLWFEQEREGDEDVELLVGVYRSEEGAKGAIERLKNRPGFKDRLDGGNGGQPDLRDLFALKVEENRSDQECVGENNL
jgi:hypothetical protein